LALHHSLAVVGCVALSTETLEYRCLGLLDLEDQRVGLVSTYEQRHPAARSYAADADDLTSQVDEAIFAEQAAPVLAERPPPEPIFALLGSQVGGIVTKRSKA
jgi:hypothetical protein